MTYDLRKVKLEITDLHYSSEDIQDLTHYLYCVTLI